MIHIIHEKPMFVTKIKTICKNEDRNQTLNIY